MTKIIQNPDVSQYIAATEAVKTNNGYCPCALEKTDDYKCMCRAFKEDETLSECFCGRYVRITI